MTSKKAAFREELSARIEGAIRVVEELYVNHTHVLDAAVEAVDPAISRNRDFSEILLDDMLVLFEASLAGTEIEDLPFGAYSWLYCARHGLSADNDTEANERLKKISFGERIDYADTHSDTLKVLPYLIEYDAGIIQVIRDDVYGEMVDVTSRIAMDEAQLRSTNNQEPLYEGAFNAFDELADNVRSNLPVVQMADPEDGVKLFHGYIGTLHTVLTDFMEQAAHLNTHPEIQRLLYTLPAAQRNGRSFYELVLDDAMTLMEGSLTGSNLSNPPVAAYRRLFFARWGDEAVNMWDTVESQFRTNVHMSLEDGAHSQRYGTSFALMKNLMADITLDNKTKRQLYQGFQNEMWTPFQSLMEKVGFTPQHHVVNAASFYLQKVLKDYAPKLRELFDAAVEADSESTAAEDKEFRKYKARLTIYQPEEIGDWRERLNSFVGLVEVKEALGRYETELENQQLEAHFNVSPTAGAEAGYNNMVFVGNPGLGKTEIARIVGALSKDSGLLPKGHIVVAGSKDLEGQYVGESKQKTRIALEVARGGVLLIDEAYSLRDTAGGHGWGQEVIDVIVEQAPHIRKDTIIILAGYPEETLAILDRNPGASRRFPANNIVRFKDLTEEQLAEIAKNQIHARQLAITSDAQDGLTRVIKDSKEALGKKFGNAGTVIELAAELARIKATESKHNGVIEQLREIKARGVKVVPEDLYVKWRVVSSDNVATLRAKVLEDLNKSERITPGFHLASSATALKEGGPAGAPVVMPERRERIAAVAESKPS